MTQPFPDALKVKLQAALLAALQEEDLDLEEPVTAVAVNPVLGETVIELEGDS